MGFALLAFSPTARAENVAVTGDTVYTLAGAPLKNGVVLLHDGKIEAVGPAATTPVPAGYRSLHAAVVTPGLIDAHATVGLSGLLNQPQDQDVLEKSSPFQPDLRALDAYNAKDALVAYVRSFGVTTVNTGHAPGALIPGQTMIVKTYGRSADEDVVKASAMTCVTLGNAGLTGRDLGPGRGAPSDKAPGTRAKAVAMLRAELIKAQEYAKKREAKDETKRPGRDLKYEALLRAFDGSQPLLITAQRQQDILSALRVAKEFNLKV
ncbi:MAG: amidohydrolase, partial [Opitutales bacterium]